MSNFFHSSSLNELLKLTTADHLFIKGVVDKTFNADAYFSPEGPQISLDFIVKIAQKCPEFEAICRLEQYEPFWKNQYILFGAYLSPSKNNSFLFNEHDSNHFDLIRGAYFFYHSDIERKRRKQPFSASELSCLRQAITYRSIHALQRYNDYLYSKINEAPTDREKRQLFIEIILSSKKMLELYGSFAYMMLAEAFFRYSLWLQESNHPNVKETMNAAYESLVLADLRLESSQFSIHNASLGRGLEYSNSFKFASPGAAKDGFDEWILDSKNASPVNKA